VLKPITRSWGKMSIFLLDQPRINRAGVAGENVVGGNAEFVGSLGTQVVKVFETVAARTGFNDSDAVQYGYDPLSVDMKT